MTQLTAGTARRPTEAEATALWRAWTEDDDVAARDRLVLSYTPMVTYIASAKVRELPSHFELDDLISCGLIALMQAVDRYDPEKGATFEQFAWTRVAGAVMDELRRHDPATRTARRLGREIERVRRQWLVQHEREPTCAELAHQLGVDEQELRNRLQELDQAETLSLNSVIAAGDETIEFGDTIASESLERSPEAALLATERREAMREAVGRLSEREREVLRLIHVEHLKAVEIGRMLGVSESRVSQILAGIRTKLGEHLASYEVRVPGVAA
jgi:RNA polymerase sigma factor for flagellar operon FliA